MAPLVCVLLNYGVMPPYQPPSSAFTPSWYPKDTFRGPTYHVWFHSLPPAARPLSLSSRSPSTSSFLERARVMIFLFRFPSHRVIREAQWYAPTHPPLLLPLSSCCRSSFGAVERLAQYERRLKPITMLRCSYRAWSCVALLL